MGKINQPTTPALNRVSSDDTHTVFNVDTDGIDTEVTTGEQPERDEFSLTNEAIRLISLKQQLDLDVSDTDHDQELKGILEWAKESGIKNKNQLSAKLREMRYKLGFSDPKESIRSIYQYVRLDNQIKTLVAKQEILHEQGNRSSRNEA